MILCTISISFLLIPSLFGLLYHISAALSSFVVRRLFHVLRNKQKRLQTFGTMLLQQLKLPLVGLDCRNSMGNANYGREHRF